MKTVADLLAVSFISGFKSTQEFVSYNGGIPGNLSNLERIKARYDAEENKKFDSSPINSADTFPIKFGTTVLIPFSAIDRDILPLVNDNAIASVDSNAFISNALKNFYTDPKNVRSILSKKETTKLGNYKEMFNHISVWLWSKSLSSFVDGDKIKNDDTIINITPYIGNINTSVTKNGGSFSFTLDPVLGKFNDATDKWEIDHATIKNLKDENYVSHSRISNFDQLRSSYYFHNIIQENDLIWIRFETLESEKDRLTNKHTFEVDKSELQFKNFDMIGLIDVQSVGSNFSNNEITINVQGRDLMKLFIEDGVYFYPFDFIQGGIFANANKDQDDRLRRYDGELLSRFQISYKKIENVLAFIINALGTIKICSDELFSYYKNNSSTIDKIYQVNGSNDRRTKRFKLSNNQQQQIIDNNVSNENEKYNEDIEAIKNCRLDSGLISDDEDTVAKNIWNTIQIFFKDAGIKLRNETKDWIEFTRPDNTLIKTNEFPIELSTGSDVLYKVSNNKQIVGNPNNGKQPTSSAISCMKIMIKNYFNRQERNNYKTDTYEEVPLKGIWQIVKLVIDKSVQNRLLADSSIGNEHGSLINAIRKVCQEPFVEFYGDTVGDQYYLTVRKPPFDQQGFVSLLDGIVLNENGETVKTEPIIINILDDDIIDENLQYGAEAFSWYHINPMANLAGGKDMAFAFLKAVFFKEYADVFGSRPLDLSTNYIPFIPFENGENQRSNAYMIQQGIEDLRYMIQSNAYLPFVRRGSITIAGGNRKIKRGCLVRLVSTGEVGFVESVSNSASFSLANIDRTTTITVDRLMVEKYIKNNNGISYFNLIDTDIDDTLFTKDLTIEKGIEITGRWKVNVDVFNFFLKAKQFANSSAPIIANSFKKGKVRKSSAVFV